ncbi:MAG: metallophosphoesterase family protein [Thermoleophilia bacterium]
MRTLVISDIHGNIDALRAIDEPCDRVVCLGDIVDYGPEPAACIDYLRNLTVPLLRVRGNHDNAVAFRVDCACGEAFKHLSLLTREYMWQVLDREQLEWIGEPETSLKLESGGSSIYATHAAPSDNLFRYLTPETGDEELALELKTASADIVLTGHTHKPFIRKIDGRLMVNVGSVGQPRDGIPRASYAIIEDGRVELKRVDYDLAAAVARLRAIPLDPAAIGELVYILEHADTPPKKQGDVFLPQCKCI